MPLQAVACRYLPTHFCLLSSPSPLVFIQPLCAILLGIGHLFECPQCMLRQLWAGGDAKCLLGAPRAWEVRRFGLTFFIHLQCLTVLFPVYSLARHFLILGCPISTFKLQHCSDQCSYSRVFTVRVPHNSPIWWHSHRWWREEPPRPVARGPMPQPSWEL